MKARGTTTQGRLDSFFTITSIPNLKRKSDVKKNTPNKKGPGAGKGRGRQPK